MVHELLESHLSVFVLNYKSVPQGPGFAQIFGFGGHDGVWEGHEGQGQVCESVLEHLNLKKITGYFTKTGEINEIAIWAEELHKQIGWFQSNLLQKKLIEAKKRSQK